MEVSKWEQSVSMITMNGTETVESTEEGNILEPFQSNT